MNSNRMYRQGDVLVCAVAEIPATARPVQNTYRIVLAHGEATGHAHAIAVDEAREFSLADADGESCCRRAVRDRQAARVTPQEVRYVAD